LPFAFYLSPFTLALLLLPLFHNAPLSISQINSDM
jgi:hypothetical protein